MKRKTANQTANQIVAAVQLLLAIGAIVFMLTHWNGF